MRKSVKRKSFKKDIKGLEEKDWVKYCIKKIMCGLAICVPMKKEVSGKEEKETVK